MIQVGFPMWGSDEISKPSFLCAFLADDGTLCKDAVATALGSLAIRLTYADAACRRISQTVRRLRYLNHEDNYRCYLDEL